MTGPEVLDRIIARRAELDGLKGQLIGPLSEVRAERARQRMCEQLVDEQATTRSPFTPLSLDWAGGMDTAEKTSLFKIATSRRLLGQYR